MIVDGLDFNKLTKENLKEQINKIKERALQVSLKNGL